MKKLLFSVITAFLTLTSIQAMESERPFLYRLVDMLLQQGNVPGIIALIDASQGGLNVNEYKTPDGGTLLDVAVTRGSFTAAQLLLEKYGANPNIQNKNGGMTALMWACIRQDLSMMQLLLLHGANPYTQGWDIYAEMHGKSARMVNSFDLARIYAADNPAILDLLNKYKK